MQTCQSTWASLVAQVVKEAACSAGDLGSIPRLGISSGEGNDYPLQYFCLENSMDRGAWWATVHGVAESETAEQLSIHSHQSTWLVKLALQSLWSLRKVSQVGIIFSKRALSREEAVVYQQGKASIQYENIQTMTERYLSPWDVGSCIKSIYQTSNGPLVSLQCPGAVQADFPELCFREVE